MDCQWFEKYISFQEKNFRILDAQRYYIEDSFDFVVQSVGVYDNKDIMKTGAKILYNKFFFNRIIKVVLPVFNPKLIFMFNIVFLFIT